MAWTRCGSHSPPTPSTTWSDATGVSAEKIAAAARAFAQAGSAAIVYALDNVAQAERAPVTDALVNLALGDGQPWEVRKRPLPATARRREPGRL